MDKRHSQSKANARKGSLPVRSQSPTGRLGLVGKAVSRPGSASKGSSGMGFSPPVPSSWRLGMYRHAAFKRGFAGTHYCEPWESALQSPPRVQLHRGVFIIGMNIIKATAS